MTKKLFSLFLALMMLLSSSALAEMVAEITDVTTQGLAATDELTGMPTPELPLVNEPLTLTVKFPRQPNHGDFDNMWFLKEVAEKTGITLKVEPIEATGWTERLSLDFASGDYSDIYLGGITFNDAGIYGTAGMLLPLEELVAEYAPNAQKILDTLPDSRKNITSSDGHIYVMPAFDTPGRDMIVKSGFLNDKWLENLGLERPTTVDELYDCLVAVRDNDANGNGDPNDEIPLSYVYSASSTNWGAGVTILYAYGFVDMRHDVIDDQYVFVPMQDNFREYLKYMNKLYEENLLDKEIFTQSDAQYNAKLAEYTVFMTSPEMQQSFSDENRQIEYSLVGPLTSAVSPVKTWGAQSSEKVGSGAMCITDKCDEKKAIAAIKLLDYLYSEEASFMTKCGPEKGNWDGVGGWSRTGVKEDGSVAYSIDYNSEKYNSFWDFRCANGLMNIPFLYTSVHAELVLGASVWGSHMSKSAYASGAYVARRFGYPSGVTFTEDEQDILAPFVLLDSYVDQNVAKFITGALDIEDDTTWENYIQTIKDMDVDTLIEVRQEAYDRWNG